MSALINRLIAEIESAPEPVQRDVLDFVVFLKSRHAGQSNGHENLLPLAQSAWAVDWDSPQEDNEWRGLWNEKSG